MDRYATTDVRHVALCALRYSLEMSHSYPRLQRYTRFLPSGTYIAFKLDAAKAKEVGYCSKCPPPPTITIKCQLPVWVFEVLHQP